MKFYLSLNHIHTLIITKPAAMCVNLTNIIPATSAQAIPTKTLFLKNTPQMQKTFPGSTFHVSF